MSQYKVIKPHRNKLYISYSEISEGSYNREANLKKNIKKNVYTLKQTDR